MCLRRRVEKCDVRIELSNVSEVIHFFVFLVLLNKWERLHNKIKENIQHTGIYETLKKDVLSFKRDLTNVLERTEEQDNSEDDGELEHRLHTFRVSNLNDNKSSKTTLPVRS